eukprot:CAMPEP_0201900278 /NCGR_PEP_ID=MMETSP0902-20130614/52008_1 /ASSEMBLY_ACC=CAM_ASM_000551 /TAXON_ID=420261 /ORGANISM="Thalassiosira antarctica, Strain CCMP982" /LENGTH=189 /DNA_ID=CAMNT_0048433893 /DNA_START=119 /DNA_END=688 /DNA_ORIENTATION=-
MSKSFGSLSPGNFGTLTQLATEMDIKGKAISTLSQPITENMKVMDIALHPKSPPERNHGSTNNSIIPPTASKFSSTAIISEIERSMKGNRAFIQEKTNDCQKLNDYICEKMQDICRLGTKVMELVASEEARMVVLEKKMKETHFEVADIRDENRSLAKDFGEAWEHMFHVRGKLQMFNSGAVLRQYIPE